MPGGDGTGPMGQGPITGGGRGSCAAGAGVPFIRAGYFGRGGGRGRGFRNCFYATGLPGWLRRNTERQAFGGFGSIASKEDEAKMLKDQAEMLKTQLEEMQARIQILEKKEESGKK